jgi:hypothetical protein
MSIERVPNAAGMARTVVETSLGGTPHAARVALVDARTCVRTIHERPD